MGKISFIFVAFFLLFFAAQTFAAEIYFGTRGQKIGLGELFEIGVFINTENAPINTIAGKIGFSPEFLELKEIREGNSIINFWIEKPKIGEREVMFSGIIPGGYIGQAGFLFSFILEAEKVGEAAITITEEQVFLNDGQGSKAVVRQSPLFLRIEESVPVGHLSFPEDVEPPEPFELIVAQDPKIFGGKYFLVFAAQDKGSGIDYYKVQESKDKQPEGGEWILAESPYVLKDQKLRSYIYVRAVDRTGNERLSESEPLKPLAWYKNYLIFVIILLVGIILFLGKFLWKKLYRPS